jgi:hypothetical protein
MLMIMCYNQADKTRQQCARRRRSLRVVYCASHRAGQLGENGSPLPSIYTLLIMPDKLVASGSPNTIYAKYITSVVVYILYV